MRSPFLNFLVLSMALSFTSLLVKAVALPQSRVQSPAPKSAPVMGYLFFMNQKDAQAYERLGGFPPSLGKYTKTIYPGPTNPSLSDGVRGCKIHDTHGLINAAREQRALHYDSSRIITKEEQEVLVGAGPIPPILFRDIQLGITDPPKANLVMHIPSEWIQRYPPTLKCGLLTDARTSESRPTVNFFEWGIEGLPEKFKKHSNF
ncbi:uncharacterized protein C8R40DRAFT_1108256 [Lentinula edodes]|uniref:uncharacterized protein n=1 Tax=Lentinula edodes TaxID=5353 RepID=UPI001E8E6A81|nr:uncharacterized protein C8R40DRAFT_1108256 [Lentinula edodes]KAH7874335.1 hypothetical protein C8R40DRAFT_1108256 [Lentinula edodes]